MRTIKHFSKYFIFSVFFLLFWSCQQTAKDPHFLSNENYRQDVGEAFQKVKQLAKGREHQLFDVFDSSLTLKETEALKFLYAYMPLSDLANNDGAYYLKNVRLALITQDSLSWGNAIPESVFRHFVLPYRVNNEDVDSSRALFFDELYPRVKDLTMEEAALEVNHWCHEKVNYHATNSRTMSPLGVVKTAYGRCGEQSTFTVTALRSVGIPARQVYTPRWAHTDDNHAWVEVFIDQQWQFLGACEPQPKLNMGWFAAPVLRAMMVHTKAFGQYQGSERVLGEYEQYSILNLLQNYAPVKPLFVKVLDANGKALPDIKVEFGLYNYAEFYPLKQSITKADGLASLTTGFGDIRVMASDTLGHFEWAMVSVEKIDTLNITLNKTVGTTYRLSFDNVPPIAKDPVKVETDQMEANSIRFNQEDSIRNQFISTFYTAEKSKALAETLGYDTELLQALLPEARGNYDEIIKYLKAAQPLKSPYTLPLLKVIETKDLQDVTAEILMNHLSNFQVFDNSPNLYSEELIEQYILNPRMQLEQLTAYRDFLKTHFSNLKGTKPKEKVESLIVWIKTNIKIDKDLNYYGIALSPQGLYELKVSDPESRNQFFVAVLRSLGIPARIEQTTLKPQYFNGEWMNVTFEAEQSQFKSTKAFITFVKGEGQSIEPQYWIHFGLAKYRNQTFVTLEYDWEKKLSDFSPNIEIEPGYYQLTTGNRMPDGTVLVNQSFFSLKEGEHLSLPIEVRANRSALEVLAQCNQKIEKGSYAIFGWIDPKTEPGNHFINDFKALEDVFTEQNIPLNFRVENNDKYKALLSKLPSTFPTQTDVNWDQLKEFYKQTQLSNTIDLPVFIVVDAKGNVLFHSSGYNIGTPEQLLKISERLK